MLFIEALIPIFGICAVFSIPIIAIWTSYKLKMKRLEQESGGGDSKELRRELGTMMMENELLKERLTALEQIVSDLPSVNNEDRKRLQINLDKELTDADIERQKALDRLNK
jgi:hypothetical protein